MHELMLPRARWRGFFVALAVCLVALGTTAGASVPETSTPTVWSVTNGVRAGRFYGVSCTSAKQCVAVGESGTIRSRAETWDGTSWTPTLPPLHATSNAFTDVSCSSPNRCMAVGSLRRDGQLHGLAEIWNGKKWYFTFSTLRVTHLDAVSCPTRTFCVAVGVNTVPNVEDRAAAQYWDGQHWSLMTLPKLPALWNAGLRGVSCVSAKRCVAVGTVTGTRGATQQLIENWDGTHWSIAPTPAATTLGRELEGVSCTSAFHCVAVGWSGSKSGRDPTLIETWNGTQWSITPSPNFDDPLALNRLSSVSCASSTSCVAVGFATAANKPSDANPLLETWDGTRWTTMPTPTASSGHDYLSGVSCTTAYCGVVGFSTVNAALDAQTFTLAGAIAPRSVTVSWTAAENRRLGQIAAYLHQSPASAQKTAVYTTAYLTALGNGARTPTHLPPMGSAASYTNTWAPTELGVIDAVRVKFALGSVGATRLSVYLLSYLLALNGH
jgi:hypothetical protein